MNYDVIMDWLIWTFGLSYDLAFRIARQGIMLAIIGLSMTIAWLGYVAVGIVHEWDVRSDKRIRG